jgi:ataxia telangiectasia mutated family protein
MSKVSKLPDFEQCENVVPPSLMKALIWEPYHCPPISTDARGYKSNLPWPHLNLETPVAAPQWARDLALALALSAEDDPVVGALSEVLYSVPDISVKLLPFVLHDVLLLESGENQVCRGKVSEIFNEVLRVVDETTISHGQIVLHAILYLRQRQRPQESTIVEREEWLDIDYGLAASAAVQCKMYKTALM